MQAAASDVTTNYRWVIGADTDQWQSASTQERPHVLTSIIKDFDMQSYALIEDYLDDGLEAGPRRLTVADDMITYATSGDCAECRCSHQPRPNDPAARLGRDPTAAYSNK